MPKIKIFKQMTLPELIEWHWEHNQGVRIYYDQINGNSTEFDENDVVYVEHEIQKSDLYKVEIDFEYTLDTVFDELFVFLKNGLSQIYEYKSLSQVIKVLNENDISFITAHIDSDYLTVWDKDK